MENRQKRADVEVATQKLVEAVAEIQRLTGAFGLQKSFEKPIYIHLDASALLKLDSNPTIIENADAPFPYCIETSICGVKFFAMLFKDELERYGLEKRAS